MDKNKVYIILEGNGTAEEKRSSLIEYVSYSIRKLPQDIVGRQRLAQNFYDLLDTNYFADEDDDKLETVLKKAGELKTDANQSDDAWHNIEELVEHL